MKSKFTVPITYGIIGAFAMAIIGFLSYLFYRALFGSFMMQILTGFSYMAIIIFIAVWGGVTFRRAQNGVLSFGDAFLGIFIIYAITAFGSVATGYLIPNVIDKEYPEQILRLVQNTTQEYMEKMGAPDEQIEKTMSEMTLEKFKPGVVSSIKSYGGWLIFGAVISLIVGAFIKRNPSPLPPMADVNTNT